MKNKWRVTVVWQDKTEVHDLDSYYEILHFIFDVVVFRIKKENIIIKLEVVEEKNDKE